MFRLVLTFFLSIWFGLAYCNSAKADEQVINAYSLLKDSSNSLTIDRVSNPELSHFFNPLPGYAFDKTTSTYWLRVNIKSQSPQAKSWILKLPYIDYVEVYKPEKSGWTMEVTGWDIPIGERPVPHGEYVAVELPVSTSDNTYYIKFVSQSLFSYHLRNTNSLKLIAPEEFWTYYHWARYIHGLFLGIAIALILYNLIIYSRYREKSFLAYAVFMITQTVYHLSITGFLQEFVLFNFPSIAKLTPFFIAGISLMGYIYFSRIYLDTAKYAPKLDKIYRWFYLLIILICSIGIVTRIDVANNILLLTGIFVITIPLSIAIMAFRKGFTPARYFIVASILPYIAYLLFAFVRFKLVPDVFLTRYALQITFPLQAFLFAVGIADIMNLIRIELAEKKLEKERLEKEQEIAMKNILEKQNVELEIKVAERTHQLEEKKREVEMDREIIKKEREKSDALLLNILPEKIAKRLKAGEGMIAERFDQVTVFFSDIVGFTEMSKQITPEQLVDRLNTIFSEMDAIAFKHGLEKIKTIGDAYMCVCGLPEPQKDHAHRVAKFALDVKEVIEKLNSTPEMNTLAVRMGIHSGTVVAGVIGKRKFAYDLWGETVNLASRLESHAEVMQIHCSQATFNLLKNNFRFTPRGTVELRGLGKQETYFLVEEIK